MHPADLPVQKHRQEHLVQGAHCYHQDATGSARDAQGESSWLPGAARGEPIQEKELIRIRPSREYRRKASEVGKKEINFIEQNREFQKVSKVSDLPSDPLPTLVLGGHHVREGREGGLARVG